MKFKDGIPFYFTDLPVVSKCH